MKKLFHLISPNLNETNLTSSKAKTLNEHISKRVSVQNSPPMFLRIEAAIPYTLKTGRNSREPEQDNDSICSFNLKGTRAEAFELHPSSSRRAELSIT